MICTCTERCLSPCSKTRVRTKVDLVTKKGRGRQVQRVLVVQSRFPTKETFRKRSGGSSFTRELVTCQR